MGETQLNPPVTPPLTWILLFPASWLYATAQSVAPPPPPNSNLGIYSNFDPCMAIIILILVSSFVFITLFSIYVRHCSETMISVPPPADDGSVKRGLDPAVIRTFPTFIYSAVKDLKLGKGALECAVCLSEFEDDEILHLIPKCDHVFHPDCIDLWLGSHVTCPVCRANLTIEQKEPARLTNANNDLNSNQNQNQNQNENNSVSEIVIDVNDELSRSNEVQLGETVRRNDAVSLKFPRSHSTGHSLVLAGVNVERYTLRLPAEIRKQLINGKIKRTQSFSVVLGREGSSRVIGVEEIEVTEENVIWTGGFCRGLHRLFRRRGLVNFLKFEREGSSDSNSRNLLMAVTGPLNCLNMKVDQGEESSSRPSKPLI